MAATVSAIKWQSTGSEMATEGLITLSGTYATGGVALTQLALGLSTVNSATFEQGAYTFKYDISNQKLLLYYSAGFTPAGTISKPSFTVAASGAIGTNMEVGLSADSASATFEGGTGITASRTLTTTSPVGTPTLTGTAVDPTALVEVANGASLTGITVNYRAVGY